MRVAVLHSPQQAHQALTSLWRLAKSHLLAGHRLEVELRPARRNGNQNALLHVLLSDIARQVEWAGKYRSAEVWKRLLTAAWLRARGESVEVLPAVDGHGVDVVFRRTSGLSKAECAELIDFIQAWAAQQGVELSQLQDT